MKANISVASIVQHNKFLMTIKPDNRELFRFSSVTLTLSDTLTVVGPWFEQNIDCTPEKCGSSTIPFNAWLFLVQNIKKFSKKSKEIHLSVEDGQIKLGTVCINNDKIKVIQHAKAKLEFPINATTKMIVDFFIKNNEEVLQDAGLKETAKAVFEKFDQKIRIAVNALEDYEIEYHDILRMIAEKYKANDFNSFLNLFPKNKS